MNAKKNYIASTHEPITHSGNIVCHELRGQTEAYIIINNTKYKNCPSLQHENKIVDVTHNIEHSIKLALC